MQSQMDRRYIAGGSPNRASVCKSVFLSLLSRFIMGCLIQLGRFVVMSTHMSMDYGLCGVWGVVRHK